jgi:hypothetical protein
VSTVDPADAKKVFYNELSSEEGDKWAALLKPHSLGAYATPTSYAAWRHIPSTYVICAADKTSITPELAESMISTARELEPTAFDVVERSDTDHCPMLSRPEWLAGVLKRAAGEH